MELTVLLVGISVAAGIYMVLFIASAAVAWVYYKRFMRLMEYTRRASREELPDPRVHWREGLLRRVPSAANSPASRARQERRDRRHRQTRFQEPEQDQQRDQQGQQQQQEWQHEQREQQDEEFGSPSTRPPPAPTPSPQQPGPSAPVRPPRSPERNEADSSGEDRGRAL